MLNEVLGVVHIMFYKIKDLDKMLENSHDWASLSLPPSPTPTATATSYY